MQPTENIAIANGDQSLSASDDANHSSTGERRFSASEEVQTGEDTESDISANSEPDTSDAAPEQSDVLRTAARCFGPARAGA